MSRKFLVPIDLSTNELQNAVIQNLTSDPTGVKGRVYFDSNTGVNVLKLYDGTSWKTISTGSGSFYLGSTSISLGNSSGDVTTVAGLSSVTSTSFVGALTGNASTATTLETARNINGVSFNGSANITVKASTTNTLGLTSGGNLAFSSGTTWDGGTSGVTIGLSTTPTGLTSINGISVSGSSGTFLTTASTSSSLTSVGTLTGLTMGGNIAMGTNKITGLGDPTSDQDAATKKYVDDRVAGLTWKASAHLLADANVALTGTSGTLVIDSHAALDSGDNGYRILLTNQTTDTQNGIYVYTDAGSGYTLTRATDADPYSELINATIFIAEGTVYGKTSWTQANGYITSFAGQDWVQFNGAQTYNAGAGLVLDGNTFNIGGTSGRIVANSDTIDLATTAVSANSYGSSTAIPTFTVDAYGRLTAASSVAHADATTSSKGIASFSSTYFSVSSGAVSLASGAAKANGAATKQTGTNSSGTTTTVNHVLGQWVTAQMFDTSTGALVEVDVVNASTDGGTTTFTFASSQTAGAYTYVIIG